MRLPCPAWMTLMAFVMGAAAASAQSADAGVPVDDGGVADTVVDGGPPPDPAPFLDVDLPPPPPPPSTTTEAKPVQTTPSFEPDLVSGAATPKETVVVEPAPDVHFVVTGGLSGIRSGTEAFFNSAAFRGADGAPFFMEDATLTALRTHDALYFRTDASLDEETLLWAAASARKTKHQAHLLLSPSTLAVSLDDTSRDVFATPRGQLLGRAMAAVQLTRQVERVELPNGAAVWAVADAAGQRPLRWPTETDPLQVVPSARGRLSLTAPTGDTPSPVFLLARTKASTPRAFGIVDELLQKAGGKATYLDVGGALSSDTDATQETANAVKQLLLARSPAVLGAGRAELGARHLDDNVLKDAPYVLAATSALAPSFRRVTTPTQRHVLFVALGGLGRRTRALLPADVKTLSTSETVLLAGEQASKAATDLVVGMALSKEGQSAALASSTFDLVFHLSSSRIAALPASDDIHLKDNHARGFHAGPTLVRVSSADVTEVRVWFDDRRQVERIQVRRTPIVDEGREAADGVLALQGQQQRQPKNPPGLLNRAHLDDDEQEWTGKDLTRVLGSFVRTQLGVEMAILRERPSPVPMHGHIPPALAEAWLHGRARVQTANVRGDALLKMFSALSTGQLKNRFYVVGGSRSKKTVGMRPIVATEFYSVAFTPDLTAELASVGIALNKTSTTEDERPLFTYARRGLAEQADAATLQHLLDSADGEPTHAFVAELTDVAVGIMGNARTNNYAFGTVQNARVQNPAYMGFNLDGTAAVAYDGPWVFVGARLQSQFAAQSQCNLAADDAAGDVAPTDLSFERLGHEVCKAQFRPARQVSSFLESRDLLLAESEARLVLHRLLDAPPAWTPSPTLKVAFQTEWTPAEGEDARRRKELRLSLGGTLSPSAVWKQIALAALVEYDLAYEQLNPNELESIDHFLQPTPGSVEAGLEGSVEMAQKLGSFMLKYDGMARAYVPTPDDSDDDLLFLTQHVVRLEAPPVWGIRFGAFADLFVAAPKTDPFERGLAASLILGVSASTSGRFKSLPTLRPLASVPR